MTARAVPPPTWAVPPALPPQVVDLARHLQRIGQDYPTTELLVAALELVARAVAESVTEPELINPLLETWLRTAQMRAHLIWRQQERARCDA